MPITDDMPLGTLNNYLPPDIQAINLALADTYGKDLLGRPKFRITHSDLAMEKRKGEFNEFYGKIFVRSYIGTKEVPKYNYFRGFVLEQLVYSPNEELANSRNGHYEPLWTDWGKENRPNLRAAKLVVRSVLFGVKHSKEDWQKMEADEDAASYDKIRGEVENAATAGSGEQIGYRKV